MFLISRYLIYENNSLSVKSAFNLKVCKYDENKITLVTP